MDKDFAKKMISSINNMRAKVVEAKGESVKGLPPVTPLKDKKNIKILKNRETES